MEEFLASRLDGDECDEGVRARRTESRRILFRGNEFGGEEVEVVGTLSGWDDYDPGSRVVILPLRTILINNADRDAVRCDSLLYGSTA